MVGVFRGVMDAFVLAAMEFFMIVFVFESVYYSKTCLKRPSIKKAKIGFQDQLSLYAGKAGLKA